MTADAWADALIAALASTTLAADACNQYADDGSVGNALRRANLARYFAQLETLRPPLLLVGEAPSYLGCRRTGIPFGSERLLVEGIEPVGLLGVGRGYQRAWDEGPVRSEQTASILWGELLALGVPAAGWNAFPFHPHRLGLPDTNRKPRVPEVLLGQPFLHTVIMHLGDPRVVAVGNTAHEALTLLGVEHARVRHPAQGGKREFAVGLRAVVAELGLRVLQ